MSGGRGVRGNREVSPLFLLRGGGGDRIDTTPEATSKEGGSWGKHGFPHGGEPKASDAHAARSNARSTAADAGNFRSQASPRRASNRRSSPLRSTCQRVMPWYAIDGKA
jgi:hypothetical protein